MKKDLKKLKKTLALGFVLSKICTVDLRQQTNREISGWVASSVGRAADF